MQLIRNSSLTDYYQKNVPPRKQTEPNDKRNRVTAFYRKQTKLWEGKFFTGVLKREGVGNIICIMG